ncbi:helicase-exonuclease AddAB subunit AddA [Alkaliphilus pronyensis]|uniref:ATP-dependent helicase/nuclease subunit A n=1 Tax=Alkaliphilus pronyensis TaxID=1482732 RepID=A0A6I0F0N7_9FIRM|nr:helicase-exonuclease AddAB subunit AddA [Alkaliphilus pronyensis]KAB3534145.1 helicase-exonuclease AddAB subunit AddA [Alkaliphilus pronyensis]
MPSWTKQQEAAITARNSNLLVSAAAGSGKTAVLVERIIKLIIEDEVNIDELLIVTFTNAAAGEMRERIAKAIIKELEVKNSKEEHLRKQLTLLNKATIATLHSFCIEIVKKHFHFINIDPSFRIGDATETLLLKQEAIEEVFEEEYNEGNQLFHRLVEAYGGRRDDNQLQELVLNIYSFIQSQPYPLMWLKEKVELFSMNLEEFYKSPWVKTIKQSIILRLKGIKDLLLEAINVCQKPMGPYQYEAAITNDILVIDALINAIEVGLVEFYSSLKEVKHQTLGRCKEADEALKEEAKKLRNTAKDGIKKLKNEILSASPKEYVEDLNSLQPLMEYLAKIVEDFNSTYQNKKAEKGIVDFNDLEHFALRLLENPMVSQEYQEGFRYIFIDEYQDSNIVQETIIQRIKRKNNLFMVGDVKQSIYRFRLADPSLFIDKYDTFSSEEDGLNRRIDLAKNFRSRKEILDGVNFIFKNIMSRTVGEINYTEEVFLNAGGEFPVTEDKSLELHLIEKDPDIEEASQAIEELEDIDVEAKIIAKRIKAALKEEVYDGATGSFRRVQYRDIVVLLRATKQWAPSFLQTFLQEGIPAYADIGSGYFEAIEVSLFMNLLKVIDNKRQDIPLLSVMASPIGGFTINELITVRTEYRDKSYFNGIFKYINEKSDGLSKKLNSFINRIEEWAEEAKYTRMDELISKLYTDTGYYHYVGAMPGGIQRQANLRVLLDRANQFQSTSIRGLFNFISFIEKLQSNRGDMGSAKILSENDNVVRLMSIHKSKGLEFPVVIVAGLGKQFNLRDLNNRMLLHKDLGIGPDYVDPDLRIIRETIAKMAMKDKIKLESLSEEMRILYVALTRPKDKLILVGSVKQLEKKCRKWGRPLLDYSIAGAITYLDWIGGLLVKHRDGEKLRRIADLELLEADLLEDNSRWSIKIHNKGQLVGEELQENTERELLKKRLESPDLEATSYKDDINRRLNWHYPYVAATKIPSKLSVTDIKQSQISKLEGLGIKIPKLIKIPKFIDKSNTLSAAEKGTVLHFVMQHLDFSRGLSFKDIEEQIGGMVTNELLTEVEAATVNVAKIEKFFSSDIGKRLLRAKEVYREVPFNIKKTASEVLDGIESDEELLIQGVIDCYFKEAEGIVLIDYKSDYVFEDVELIVTKYKTQLQLYKEALQAIGGEEIKECYIYLFDKDKAIII